MSARARHRSRLLLPATLLLVGLLHARNSDAGEPVAVRYPETSDHRGLVLEALDGTKLAEGEFQQVPAGDNIDSRLTFRFRDGSFYEERTTFSQKQHFRLVTHHVVMKGPSFPQATDMSIDVGAGRVTVRYSATGSEPRVASDRLDLPPDLANGLVPTLLKNTPAGAAMNMFGYVAATPKPRLVTLAIAAASNDDVPVDGGTRRATHYVLKVKIGGVGGVFAPLVGKQPPDVHVWILGGDAPAFWMAEQPLYVGGPVWRIKVAAAAR